MALLVIQIAMPHGVRSVGWTKPKSYRIWVPAPIEHFYWSGRYLLRLPSDLHRVPLALVLLSLAAPELSRLPLADHLRL